MTELPASQYEQSDKLVARQRFWSTARAEEPFDLIEWVLDITDIENAPSTSVLDAGCGNGRYAGALAVRGYTGRYAGLDSSVGMLATFDVGSRLCADIGRLPFETDAFDRSIAAHVLYHLSDPALGIAELARVTRPDGLVVAVTNGPESLAELKALVETAVGTDWRMVRPADGVFGLHNGAAQLDAHFTDITVVRAPAPAVLVDDPDVVASYVWSLGDVYEAEAGVDWTGVVRTVRAGAAAALAEGGELRFTRDMGAFLCRA